MSNRPIWHSKIWPQPAQNGRSVKAEAELRAVCTITPQNALQIHPNAGGRTFGFSKFRFFWQTLHTMSDSGPLPSAGITLLLWYYGPIRHPTSPAYPPRDANSLCAAALIGLPVMPCSPSSRRASAITPARRVGARIALFPTTQRTSPNYRWVVPRIDRFEACLTFTHVPARLVAQPPHGRSFDTAVLHATSLPP